MSRLLDSYPVVITIPLAWGDFVETISALSSLISRRCTLPEPSHLRRGRQ